MGRSIGQGGGTSITFDKTVGFTVSNDFPISGKFGEGKMKIISRNEAVIIPAKNIRVRLWGAGGADCGCGGGFAMKVITGLTIGSSVNATVGAGGTQTVANGGATSFGAYCSASGGSGKVVNLAASLVQVPGKGIGGDINSSGGMVYRSATTNSGTASGAGVGNLMGDGGGSNQAGTSGGGGDIEDAITSNGPGANGNPGMAPVGLFSLDFVGCGGGTGARRWISTNLDGVASANAGNGGGGGWRRDGCLPGGGGGGRADGANGYIIMEW